MRYTAIFLLALICCQAVSAVSLRKSAETTKNSIAIERLRFIAKKSTIASQIVSAVELHLTSGGRVDEVIQIVQDALDDVSNKRASLSDDYLTKKTNLENLIEQLNGDLANERADLEVANSEIDRLNGVLDTLAAQIANLEIEL